jgi:hypothetical protein
VTKRILGSGDGRQEDVVTIRLWDKSKNLELIFKHLGMLKDRVAVEGDWDKWATRLPEIRSCLI